jgi:glycerol uptake facilitator-like aquaporin
MLIILLSKNAPISTILPLLLVKFIIGMLSGFVIDFIFRNKNKKKETYSICKEEHCGCEHEENLFKSSLIHTIKTFIFIFIATFIITYVFELFGEEYLSKLLLKDTLISPFITSLIGLIPNCASSVILTELYLSNSINFASIVSGLLTGSGVAILVLFKSNKNIKENLSILGLVYSIGVITGIIISIISYII